MFIVSNPCKWSVKIIIKDYMCFVSLSLSKMLLNQSQLKFVDKWKLLRKETMCYTEEGRRGGIGSSCRQRQRKSNSEKNQIRSCDHVWFPSLSEYFVPEHAVLSTSLVSLCYATDLAKRSWAKLHTLLHLLIKSVTYDLTEEHHNSLLKHLTETKTPLFYSPFFFYCITCLPFLLFWHYLHF